MGKNINIQLNSRLVMMNTNIRSCSTTKLNKVIDIMANRRVDIAIVTEAKRFSRVEGSEFNPIVAQLLKAGYSIHEAV